ncbi:unnamed protein product [Caenorhabditis angaria]|uniref:Serpentine receptor class r-10 n=1 Tax=Caenorhabditis angaria TaxID=860376 RepID=A0A9P1IVU6_9PELO|nr:unnamed protein product [Caenorhabditis angaria]
MSDVFWLNLTTGCEYFGLAMSILGNSMLLGCLLKRPNEGIGSYKYLMITFSIFSLFYTAVETFLRPLLHHYDNTLFVIQRKRFDYSTTVARAISSIYCGCFAMSFVLFALHFLYRYFAACKPDNLRHFQGKKFLYWVFGAILISLTWSACAFFCYPHTSRTDSSLRYVLATSYGLEFNSVDYVPYNYYVYPNNGTEKQLNMLNMIGVIHHVTVMQISLGIVQNYGIKTYSTICAFKGTSTRTKRLQKQLFHALVIQTLIPLICMFLPNTILMVASFVDFIEFGAYANICVVMAHIYPGIDPFVTLFLIKDFRRYIKSIIFRTELSVGNSTVTQSVAKK